MWDRTRSSGQVGAALLSHVPTHSNTRISLHKDAGRFRHARSGNSLLLHWPLSASWGWSITTLIGEMPGLSQQGCGRSLNATTQPSLALLDKDSGTFPLANPVAPFAVSTASKRPTMWSHRFLVQPENSYFWASSPLRCTCARFTPRSSLLDSPSSFFL